MIGKLILISLIIVISYTLYTNKEQWVDYIQPPHNYVKTGTDPISYYRRDRYRKPYRNGFKAYKSYPYPHMEQLP